ncbi:MAG: cytochrome c peroxidase [Myxococcota bacterium]
MLFLLTGCAGLTPIPQPELADLPDETRAQVELGRTLFFDAGLSGDGTLSCASCHDPKQYGADGRTTSLGAGGEPIRRNAPSVFNAALKDFQFWDGRAATLEEQARGPLFAEVEMATTPEAVERYLGAMYAEAFGAAFPGETGPTVDQLTRALAAYERVLPAPSRFDRFLEGEREVLTDLERSGLRLFRNNCAFCHGGDGIGGDDFERLGDEIPWPNDRRQDLGRAEVTGDAADELVFVVPSLRNVTQTGPYFHDGSVETIEEAVKLMGRHQIGRDFDDTEVNALVAFLATLEAETIPPWAFAPEG